MTYQLNDTTTMVLANIGDTFTVDPMLIFLMNGKEVPVSSAIPSIRSIDIQESTIADGFNVELTHTNGRYTTRFFYTMEAVASYLQFLALHSPAEAAPAAQATDDTTPATEPATEPSDGQQVDACDAVSTSTMKRVLSAAKRLIARCDKCVKLQADGFHDAANVEMGDIITLGSSLQLEMVGFVDLDTWDAVNTSAASATHGRGDPRYWGYIAGEYVKLAEQRLAA